jgi:hypothetical protein
MGKMIDATDYANNSLSVQGHIIDRKPQSTLRHKGFLHTKSLQRASRGIQGGLPVHTVHIIINGGG